MIECQFAKGGVCTVSSMLASVPVVLDADTCRACAEQDSPQGPNRVTCSRAIWVLKQQGKDIDPELMACVQAPDYGPGSELEEMIVKARRVASWVCLGWLFAKSSGCGCNKIKSEMNLIGITKCRRNSDRFANAVVDSYLKRFPFLQIVRGRLVNVCERMVLAAINRAELRIKGKTCQGS